MFSELVAFVVASFSRLKGTYIEDEKMAKPHGSAVTTVIERRVEMMPNIPNQNSLPPVIQPSPEITVNTKHLNERCRRCGRILKNAHSQQIGFGTVCYHKFLTAKVTKPLFEVHSKTGQLTEKPVQVLKQGVGKHEDHR